MPRNGLRPDFSLSDVIESELVWVIDYLRAAVPRTLHAKETRPPLVVFTDASLECDDTAAAIGGVMYDGSSCEFFSSALSTGQLSMLQTESRHVIGAAGRLRHANLEFQCHAP